MTTIYRKVQIKKEKLREVILKNPGYLQPDLSFIDLQLGSEQEEGLIDFLGVDKSGRLLIVDFDVQENNSLLIAALAQMQWLKKNESLIKRLYCSENIDFTREPAILLVGPSFSVQLRSAVKKVVQTGIKLVSFNYILSDDKDAILFEDVFLNKSYEAQHAISAESGSEEKSEYASLVGEKSPDVPENIYMNFQPSAKTKDKSVLALDEISLSPEEIAEFMSFDKEFEKGTSSE